MNQHTTSLVAFLELGGVLYKFTDPDAVADPKLQWFAVRGQEMFPNLGMKYLTTLARMSKNERTLGVKYTKTKEDQDVTNSIMENMYDTKAHLNDCDESRLEQHAI